MMHKAWLAALALVVPATALAIDEQPSSAQDQTALALTIYNGDLALVKDTRNVRLRAGENRLAWKDVSARIQPETALLRSLDGNRFSVLEQDFEYDLLTPRSLLEKSVGEPVRVLTVNPSTGLEQREDATILAANDGVVLKYADRVEGGVSGRLGFYKLPADLHDRPTLDMLLNAGQDGTQGMELSYLTGGLGWKADYVAELSDKGDSLDLSGWVTLNNNSGTTYRNAHLQLVAGDVHRVQPEMRVMAMAKAAPASAEGGQAMQEESLFEYHLYTLDRPINLLDRQTKQVALLTAHNLPVKKEYVLRGADYYYRSQYGELGTKLKADVLVEFANKGDQLGVPLPKGIVRVYKKDQGGSPQFVGEDRIDHTAKGETVRLRLGESFDISAEKKQTVFQNLANYGSRGGLIETAYQLDIHNAKNEPVTVKVIEPIAGDWQMVSENLQHKQETANTATWSVPVPAQGQAQLTWRVRIRY
jgi:hypothetical protein